MNWLKNEAELYVFHEEMQEKHLVPNVRNYLFWLEEKTTLKFLERVHKALR